MGPQQWLAVTGVVWGITGLVEPHLSNAGQPLNEVGVVQGFATAALLFGWCKAHARAHSIQPPTGAALLVGLIAPIGVPYYALRGYGLRRGARLIGLAIVTLVVLAAIYLVCFEISARFAAEQFAGVRP